MNRFPLHPLPNSHLEFDDDEVVRYSRNILLPGFGAAGQATLRASTVLCVGAGGLGSPSILYLAAAGVGRLIICDGDDVDLSNLQRQIAHTTGSIGCNKAESAAASAKAINPGVDTVVVTTRVDPSSLPSLVASADVVLDGSDNFATRYLVNDACHFGHKPLVSASVFRFEGQLTSFTGAAECPCYRCLFPKMPPAGAVPSCAEAGVLGAVVGMLGTMQAVEAIKILTGIGEPLAGRLLRVDALSMDMMTFDYPWSPSCELCGAAPTIRELRAEADPGCAI